MCEKHTFLFICMEDEEKLLGGNAPQEATGKKKRCIMYSVIGAVAAVLVIVGIVLLVVLLPSGKPSIKPVVFASEDGRVVMNISLFGGQINSLKIDGEEFFHMSSLAKQDASDFIQGGNPISWPWFNFHEEDETQKIHGYARVSYFRVKQSEIGQSSVYVELTFDKNDMFLVERINASADRFAFALDTVNRNATRQYFEAGFHSYYELNARRATVSQVAGYEYEDYYNNASGTFLEDSFAIDQTRDMIIKNASMLRVEDDKKVL